MLSSIIISTLLISIPPADALTQNSELWTRQLRSDSVDLRIIAIKKLAELRQPSTLSKIADTLSDISPEVRYQAMRALTRMPNNESLSALQSRVNSETDPYLFAELKRSIKSVEDSMKAAQEKTEKAALKTAEKEAKKAGQPDVSAKSKNAAPKKSKR